jgi:hypothetical protein
LFHADLPCFLSHCCLACPIVATCTTDQPARTSLQALPFLACFLGLAPASPGGLPAPDPCPAARPDTDRPCFVPAPDDPDAAAVPTTGGSLPCSSGHLSQPALNSLRSSITWAGTVLAPGACPCPLAFVAAGSCCPPGCCFWLGAAAAALFKSCPASFPSAVCAAPAAPDAGQVRAGMTWTARRRRVGEEGERWVAYHVRTSSRVREDRAATSASRARKSYLQSCRYVTGQCHNGEVKLQQPPAQLFGISA